MIIINNRYSFIRLDTIKMKNTNSKQKNIMIIL